MKIWLIEFSVDTRWIPTSKPYYCEADALKALKRFKNITARTYRVAPYLRVSGA